MTVRGIFYTLGGTLRAPWRLAAFLVIFFAADWALSAFARTVPRPQSFVPGLLFSFSIILAAVATAQFVMLRLVEKRPWSDIGLGAAQAAPRVLCFGVALGGLGILVPSLVLLGAGWLRPESASVATGNPMLFGAQVAALMLPQSLAEELLSRGYGFSAIRDGAGPVTAVAITSAIFGALHVWNPGADAQSVTAVVLAGVFLGLIVVVTGSVYAAWMAHFAWNFVLVGVLHAKVSGITFPAPGWRLVERGPSWVTGGAWGPEGGAAACAGMVAVIAVLAWWRRVASPPVTAELSHG